MGPDLLDNPTAGMARPDLDSSQRIHAFVDAFYAAMLQDPVLAPIFLDVAAIDLEKHLPLIRAYWEKLLLGEKNYQRNTMNIHRQLAAKRPLERSDFERWLGLFHAVLDGRYAGPYAERAKLIARRIATNMHNALNPAGCAAPIQPVMPIADGP